MMLNAENARKISLDATSDANKKLINDLLSRIEDKVVKAAKQSYYSCTVELTSDEQDRMAHLASPLKKRMTDAGFKIEIGPSNKNDDNLAWVCGPSYIKVHW